MLLNFKITCLMCVYNLTHEFYFNLFFILHALSVGMTEQGLQLPSPQRVCKDRKSSWDILGVQLDSIQIWEICGSVEFYIQMIIEDS